MSSNKLKIVQPFGEKFSGNGSKHIQQNKLDAISKKTEKRIPAKGIQLENTPSVVRQAALHSTVSGKNILACKNDLELQHSLILIRPLIQLPPLAEVRVLAVAPIVAVMVGLRIAEEYQKDKALFVRCFSKEGFDADTFDNLSDRAKGYWQADIYLRQAGKQETPLKVLLKLAQPLIFKLSKAAKYLWGDVPNVANLVGRMNKGRGAVDKANRLGRLATLFYDNWEQAVGKCNVTEADLKEANRLGAQILQTSYEAKNADWIQLRETRDRAGEYLRRGIIQVRAAAQFVFRNQPEEMARYPSIFGGRKRTKRI